MKQTVVDVLVYLFENYMDEDNDETPDDQRGSVQGKLEELGFSRQEIDKAFVWLEDLAVIQNNEYYAPMESSAMRIYHPQEMALLGDEGIGFLACVEQTGILTPITRELVLDRAMALDTEVDLEQLKWIAMIVLYNHPGEESAFAWMESLVFDLAVDYLH